MTTYRAQHDALFRTVAEILFSDYIAPSETAETVAEWTETHATLMQQPKAPVVGNIAGFPITLYTLMEPSELAALIADVEGYEKR